MLSCVWVLQVLKCVKRYLTELGGSIEGVISREMEARRITAGDAEGEMYTREA